MPLTTVNPAMIGQTSTGAASLTATGSAAASLITAAGTALSADSSGRVTAPFQPSFRAQLTTTTNYQTTASDIPFNAIIFNIGSHYNNSTGGFTAPVAGRYAFFFRGFAELVGRVTVDMRVNGTTLISSYGPEQQGANCNISVVFNLATNDVVTCRLRQGTIFGGNNTADSAQFMGYLIG